MFVTSGPSDLDMPEILIRPRRLEYVQETEMKYTL